MLFNLPSRESLLVAPKAADHLGREARLREVGLGGGGEARPGEGGRGFGSF